MMCGFSSFDKKSGSILVIMLICFFFVLRVRYEAEADFLLSVLTVKLPLALLVINTGNQETAAWIRVLRRLTPFWRAMC